MSGCHCRADKSVVLRTCRNIHCFVLATVMYLRILMKWMLNKGIHVLIHFIRYCSIMQGQILSLCHYKLLGLEWSISKYPILIIRFCWQWLCFGGAVSASSSLNLPLIVHCFLSHWKIFPSYWYFTIATEGPVKFSYLGLTVSVDGDGGFIMSHLQRHGDLLFVVSSDWKQYTKVLKPIYI